MKTNIFFLGHSAIELACRHEMTLAMATPRGEILVPCRDAEELVLAGLDPGLFKLYLDAFGSPAKIEAALDDMNDIIAARVARWKKEFLT